MDIFFQFDLRVIELGAYDIVLGVDWIKSLEPISLDFNTLTLSFKKGEENVN
jgi:hypothetical protein